MSPKQPHWETYNEEMSGFDYGHALWEPAPLSHFERVQLGDVGYIHTGRFCLLFSAGCPLGNRQLGVDVPLTFKPLDVGGIDNREPLAPRCYSTDNVRATPVYPTSSSPPPSGSQPPASPPMFESFSRISFQLTGGQGAALVTRYPIYREDKLRGNRGSTFEKYTKEHYASWVEFASETERGDVNPVLVTGVDRTRDFAMLCYSTDSERSCEFTTSTPRVSSGWGTWHATGLISTNHGPQLHYPPSSTPTTGLIFSGTSHTEPVLDEYNQCVFIRYYTVRKRLGVPRVIKAGAGPHDLGGGGRENGGFPGARCDPDPDSDSGSDIASSLLSDSDGGSVTSIETESDIVVHNTTINERDEFDTIADYVFQNSDAQTVLLHHQDTTRLRTFGGSTDLSTRLLEVRPGIIVDENGVGTIEFQTGVSQPDCSPRIISITPSRIPGGRDDEEVTTSEGGDPSQTIAERAVTEALISTNTPQYPTLDLAPPLPQLFLDKNRSDDANTRAEQAKSHATDNVYQAFYVDKTNQTLDKAAQTRGAKDFADAVQKRLNENIIKYVPDMPPLGTFIPQRVYCQGTAIPATEATQDISFAMNHGQWFPARLALLGQCSTLVDGDDAVFIDPNHTIDLRIEWPGYIGWRGQVRIVDYREIPKCIPRAKLVTEIAKQLEKFIEAKKSIPIHPDYARYRVGLGAIELDHLSIAGLERVSRYSWQPRLVYTG